MQKFIKHMEIRNTIPTGDIKEVHVVNYGNTIQVNRGVSTVKDHRFWSGELIGIWRVKQLKHNK